MGFVISYLYVENKKILHYTHDAHVLNEHKRRIYFN